MIGRLHGVIAECFDDHVIIDVSGVGYLVYCSKLNINNFKIGFSYSLFIETHIREDHFHLYGFVTLKEKTIFNLLTSVNGIGPRMALTILSSALLPDEIEKAIINKSKEFFRSISGVGNKLAERIIIELYDKLGNINIKSIQSDISNINIASDAISALINLGINKTEAQNTVDLLLRKDPNLDINNLIKLALKARQY